MPVHGKPTVSDAPRLAPADYKTMAPIVRLPKASVTASGVTVGSGVRYREHPNSPGSYGSDLCAGCGSTDTLLIAIDVYEDLVGKDGSYELVCNACGKFSQHSFWR